MVISSAYDVEAGDEIVAAGAVGREECAKSPVMRRRRGDDQSRQLPRRATARPFEAQEIVAVEPEGGLVTPYFPRRPRTPDPLDQVTIVAREVMPSIDTLARVERRKRRRRPSGLLGGDIKPEPEAVTDFHSRVGPRDRRLGLRDGARSGDEANAQKKSGAVHEC